jgi:uncharacterized membrane-anchored protein
MAELYSDPTAQRSLTAEEIRDFESDPEAFALKFAHMVKLTNGGLQVLGYRLSSQFSQYFGTNITIIDIQMPFGAQDTIIHMYAIHDNTIYYIGTDQPLHTFEE